MTLFAYGRTIWCTCGHRVAADVMRRRLAQGADARFVADSMLGRLARWLRLLGFDCAHEESIADARLVQRAVDEDRIILTRDRRLELEWRVSGVCLLRSEKTYDQLREVLRRFELSDTIRLFRRCSRCNAELAFVQARDARGRAPEDVIAAQAELRECTLCGRVYWEGGHTRRIRRIAERLIAECSGRI